MLNLARPITYTISLADEEVKRLKSVIRKKETNPTIKCRCQILLALDEAHGKGYRNEQCALLVGVSKGMVHSVIGYYLKWYTLKIGAINVKRVLAKDSLPSFSSLQNHGAASIPL